MIIVAWINSLNFLKARFCSKLSLPNNVRKLANQISEKANTMNLVTGKSPISLAAAAIFMAATLCGFNKTAKDISDVSGVAENTIKNTYKSMQPKTKELIPADFKPPVKA